MTENRSIWSRRGLLQAAVAGAVAAPGFASAADAPLPGRFAEPARDLPIVEDADVIVCGAGPAGVTAAITAARAGARVRLFEVHGCLGGVWTAGLLGYLLDFNKPGFAKELVRHLDDRGARRGTGASSMGYEPEEMKLLLEDLCVEARVKFQLHTRVTAAYRDGRRLTTIVTESKSGRQAWRAPVFIDTTGDGDLGALAGCDFEVGESKACPCQPMSMDALLVVRDAAALNSFLHSTGPGDGRSTNDAKLALLAEIRKAGFDPSYGKPTLFQVRDNLLLVMMNHEYGVLAYDAAAVTDATVRARSELNKIVKGLRKLGGPWDGVQLAATAEQIGIRDGRRIRGRYVVSKDDVAGGARHDDAVTRATFSVDVHALSTEHNKSAPYSNFGIKTKPYDIPLRALIARDVDGLLLAGRCISGDFIAHASYRVTGNAVAMGEAAGAVASVAAATKRMPHEVPWSEGAAVIAKLGMRG
ncbi:FAD-dependent oxidoreductase [Humisphaera borealis]|uniref:FAD-dependent oxidoreductase n=1 Tax=Humisphaera borealis TaxID=2807512 RepID=A0A7M2WRC4_9BACT|nr:FAD-dependent oxidoreductase [Humisphaera borealis]QOV88026.1 FAD-dependent oxidoreductase [Humisphaera borealis]